ncbi:MAG: winged helix-turn-helix domain-containing protein [Terracidiphilus sp.]|jgi:TolB-like protein/DNA-binding winged helix-turn-helix (wHTH) protein/Flp pilus assembly protein TadD
MAPQDRSTLSSNNSFRTELRFGAFVLDLLSGDLTKNGRPIRLQEKPRCLLLALAERNGKLVGRADLHEQLWPNDTFGSFEDGLNAAMSKLREVLSDDPQAPRYIETVRGRGYRFIARVETVEVFDPASLESAPLPVGAASPVSAPEPEGPAAQPSPSEKKRSHKLIAAALLASVLLAATVAAIMAWRVAHTPPVSIAVLPFDNRTGNPSRDYVCSGLADELIARLDSLPVRQLRVIAPDSSRIGAGKPVNEIARELGVQYLVTGSLQQQGVNVRVSAQLVRVADQSRIWASVYDGDLSDEFVFESSIADAVERALSLSLPPLAHAAYRPEKFEARDAYLKGQYLFSQRTKAGFEGAIENFSSAVAIDPKYAAAYAQLASAYNLMGQYNWMDPKSARSLGWAAAWQAISLDPAQSEAYAALGFSYWFYQWNLPAAEQEFRKAIELDHSNVDAHHWYAIMLMTADRFPEAEQQIQAALDIDPLSPILRTNLGWLGYYEGDFPRAVQQMQTVLAANPNFLGAHYKLWYVYSVMGDQARASQEFSWVIRAIPDPVPQHDIEEANSTGGYIAALRALAADAGSSNYGSAVDAARSLIFAGDRDGALQLLELAYKNHEGWIIFVPADPAFASLRADSTFQSLIKEIGKGR